MLVGQNQPLGRATDEVGDDSIDRATASGVDRLLVELQAQEQAMLIVVTHSLELAGMLERRVELNAGKLETTAP